MSRLPFDERREQARQHAREQDVQVTCPHLIFLHVTARGGLLVKEDQELGGDAGKETWLPLQACRLTPSLATLERGDAVTIQMSKRLADEKEMYYEG
jgi:hypothetical protein